MTKTFQYSLIAICLTIVFLTGPLMSLGVAQAETIAGHIPVVDQQALPAPHLDYGIHVAPYTDADLNWIGRLEMNWVKVYTYGQAEAFRNRNVLFRMDLGWPSDWNQFRIDIQARTRDLVARGVDAIEVHNEPNLGLEWHERPSAWHYTQMLRVSYEAIKSQAPQMIVVSAGLAPTETTPEGTPQRNSAVSDIDFAREMFENDAGLYFDVFGYHPYGFNAPPEAEPARASLNFRRAEIMRALMVEYGLGEKPIWNTEFGWLRDPAEDGFPNCGEGNAAFTGFGWLKVDGQTQAEYTVRAFDYADRNWPWMGPMFLWNLNWSMIPQEALNMCSHMRYFSILKSNGATTPVLDRVIAMPRRPAPNINVVVEPEPEMALVSDAMSTEVGVTCAGLVQVGEFDVENVGKGGTFLANISVADSVSGPKVSLSTDVANPGDTVTVYADTTGLDPNMYVIFINIEADLNGTRVVQNLRGFVIVSDSFGACT